MSSNPRQGERVGVRIKDSIPQLTPKQLIAGTRTEEYRQKHMIRVG